MAYGEEILFHLLVDYDVLLCNKSNESHEYPESFWSKECDLVIPELKYFLWNWILKLLVRILPSYSFLLSMQLMILQEPKKHESSVLVLVEDE